MAYRQPVSRARVSAVRGVNCDGVMRTLTTRGLVEEAGVDIESGATLYRTTPYFLERLGHVVSRPSCRRWRRSCPTTRETIDQDACRAE